MEMEKYINDETIIKNESYEAVKDYVICPGCKHIIIDPIMCLGCIGYFCKKCTDNPAQSGKCPNGCETPNYQTVLGKKNLITKLKFKCIKGCGDEISFQDIMNHYNSDCSNKKSKIRFLSKDEMAKRKKEDIEYITGKN